MVTVCEGESGACPFFPGGRTHIHRSFPDPSVVDEDTKVKVFTRLRDEIEEWIKEKFQDDIPLKPDAI